MKYKLNRSYNGGGVVYVLKIKLSRSTGQYRANVQTAVRYQIFQKEFEITTFLDGLIISDIDGKKHSKNKIFFGK